MQLFEVITDIFKQQQNNRNETVSESFTYSWSITTETAEKKEYVCFLLLYVLLLDF